MADKNDTTTRAELREKLAPKAARLWPQIKSGEITLTDAAQKVTGRERGSGLNYTRSLLTSELAAARNWFAASSKRCKAAGKKAVR